MRSLGSTQEDAVDVRVVSATHKDLGADVQAGRFRQDLFYRLNVIEIVVPPLRERKGDLPALCDALLQRIALESGMPVPVLSPALLQQLSQHPLHGNVRELENLLHRAVALSDGDVLQLDIAGSAAPLDAAPATMPPAEQAAGEAQPSPPLSPAAKPPVVPSDLQSYLDQQEREILVRALRETGFNRTAAAARLGLSLRQIRYRIARLAIATPGGDDSHGNGADE